MLCVPGLCKPRDQLLCVRLSFDIHARMASFLYQLFLLVANCVHSRFIQVQVTFILVGHPLWFPGDMVGALHFGPGLIVFCWEVQTHKNKWSNKKMAQAHLLWILRKVGLGPTAQSKNQVHSIDLSPSHNALKPTYIGSLLCVLP